ncbi:AMP-binding protein, partial [Kitasatospora phosalacinea]
MSLTQALHRALDESPDRPTTVCAYRIRTARETADRVARLAAALTDLGVGPGDRVGILALNSDRFHEYLFATWWLGAVAHPVDTRWSPAETVHALTDSGVRVLLVDDASAALVPDLRSRCPALHTLVHCGDGPTPDGTLDYEELQTAFDPVEDRRTDTDAPALLLHTSGTTGKPKGVLISHRGLLASVTRSVRAIRSPEPGGTTLVAAPLSRIAALSDWYARALAGGTHVFLPAFSPDAFLDAVQRYRVTSCLLAPAALRALCDHPDPDGHDPGSLRHLTYGGAALDPNLLERAMKALPGAAFSQGYGMTETGVLTVLDDRDHRAGGDRLRSVGRAVPGVDLAVLGTDGQPLPPGGVGEVVTRGDHVMLGYWRRPQETAESLRDG